MLYNFFFLFYYEKSLRGNYVRKYDKFLYYFMLKDFLELFFLSLKYSEIERLIVYFRFMFVNIDEFNKY